jgi:hypothetical protein
VAQKQPFADTKYGLLKTGNGKWRVIYYVPQRRRVDGVGLVDERFDNS